MSDTISINENKTPDNGEKGELKGFAKFLNFLKSYFSKPSTIILIIFAILLTLTVVIPLLFLFILIDSVSFFKPQRPYRYSQVIINKRIKK